MLEIDIASFTSNSSAQDEVPLSNQGKYLGLLDRCYIFTSSYPHSAVCAQTWTWLEPRRYTK